MVKVGFKLKKKLDYFLKGYHVFWNLKKSNLKKKAFANVLKNTAEGFGWCWQHVLGIVSGNNIACKNDSTLTDLFVSLTAKQIVTPSKKHRTKKQRNIFQILKKWKKIMKVFDLITWNICWHCLQLRFSCVISIR